MAVMAGPDGNGAARLARPGRLRATVVGAGVGWALAFIAVGVFFRLQMYGDGSIFSYAVTIGEGWAIHWHNIAARTTVYVLCLAPAEAYVRWTGDAAGGVTLYGLLFFGSPLFGLAATLLLDRSAKRTIFVVACASTACACPLVFGFPTEMWVAHAIFWPTLARAHYGPGGVAGFAAMIVAMLALVFTHEGAVILAAAIVATALPRGRSTALRAAGALMAVLALWVAVRTMVRPDAYLAPALANAQANFFNPRIFASGEFALMASALAGYVVLFVALRAVSGTTIANLGATLIVFAALTVHWLVDTSAPHAENRYFLRTALVIATPGFALAAIALVLADDDHPPWAAAWRTRLAQWLGGPAAIGAGMAAMLIFTTVHAVETARFVTAWTAYATAVRALATGTASDPGLGDARFVSSRRIAQALQPLAWSSTTPFLSVLVAPRFDPARLVVDPSAGYFWLPCALARAHEAAERVIPAASRHLLGVYSCLHRPR